MIKRLLLYLLAGAIMLAVAISADRGYKDTALLQQYAAEIAVWLSGQESDALNWARQERSILDAALAGRQAPANQAGILAGQATKDYTVLLHRGDSLLFCSNNKVLPVLARLNGAKTRSVLELPLGYYYVYQENYNAENNLTVLVPVRFTLDEGKYRQGLFPVNHSIPAQVQVSLAATEHPVQVNGQDLCWLKASGKVQAAWVQWLKLLAYGVFLGLLMAVAFQFAVQWAKSGKALAGAALLLAIVTGLIWLNRQTGFTAQEFDQLLFFARRFETPSLIGNSLGDWLLHLALLLWLMVFFHRGFQTGELNHFPAPVRLALASVYYLLTMLSLLVGVEVYRQLVFHSSINFDFDNLLNFDSFSALAFAGIILLLIALFLFGHRLLMTTQRMALPLASRAAGIGVSGLLLYLVCLGYQDHLQVSPLYVAAFALVYVAAFDFFTDWKTPGFGGVVLWLLFFSLSSALLLYRYNNLKDSGLRLSYAQSLAADRDTALAEVQIKKVLAQIRRDTQLNNLLKPWPFKPQTSELRAHLNELIFPERYLFQNYRLGVYAFDSEGLILPQDQAKGRDFVVSENWERGAPLPDAPDIRYGTDAEGIFRYMIKIQALRMSDPTQPAEVYCFFDHQYPQPTRVYSEVFYHLPYKNLDRLSQYDFAVLKNGKLVVDQGHGNQVVFQKTLPNGQGVELITEAPRQVSAVYKSADGNTTAAVGRPLGSWIKQLYLFAVLFALTSLFIFTLALLNTYLHFLPEYYQFNFSTTGSLAKRIHYSNVALIGVAFISIGWLTYRHFNHTAENAERANLDYRAEALLTHLRTQMGGLSPASDSLRRKMPETVATLAASLSTDVNLFSPDGILLFSTQEDLARLGVLPGKMSPEALAMLSREGQTEAVVSEQVAGVEFSGRYLSLRNNQNQLLGFLGVPYYLSERQIGPEVSDFIGMLASIYVFLLLIAYSVSFLLSRSIIRPVQLISEKIKQFQLEDKNLPLEYQGDSQDELSTLIDEYNRMVEKLEESKSQLIRLERESAWREMARQVAHDIKNPLTTMKLSMQQLERVSNDPAQAAAYLKKAITRLIEQIDSLAQIASEFSMFANLDIQQKHDMVLNDVVESVYDLFSEQKEVSLNLRIAPDRYHIAGDKNHLIRVFNNLIINAIQAIPSDRKGDIQVSMYRVNQHAVVQISDNGGGIPPEIQKRVFEPNFTTKTSGSGLGLAICRKIIEALDGNIRFETRENEGTDFFVELPITAIESAERGAKVEVV
jgi:two-component system nitrogen regulation sensor histidine kinase NtrY